MEQYKLVIVMRKDLGMRAGKMVSQGGHAVHYAVKNMPSKVEELWEASGVAKITVRTDTEAEFFEVLNKAKDAGLRHFLVIDSGKTEFHGVPTKTCLSIGPVEASKVDAITGHLKLL